MFGLATASAIVPKPVYFFVNGLWEPDHELKTAWIEWYSKSPTKNLETMTPFHRLCVSPSLPNPVRQTIKLYTYSLLITEL
jgi:hypothetical protein